MRSVIDDLLPLLREGQTLILRSTVAPGTTDWLAGYVEQRRGFDVGENFFVAHVAERIEVFGAEIRQTSPVEAELAKIWTNIYRYVTFAIPNLLMMEAEQYGANVFDVIDLINHDYPRGGIARPGLTAGACLRKDFTFSEERSNAPGMLLAVSRVHESVPL